MKVLIVDDNSMIRRSVRASVDWKRLGMTVAGEASNGLEMAEQVEQHRPDIVISDVKMPRADGFQMMERAWESVPHLKFIMISGYDDFSYMREAIRKNVVDYLLKPVDETELERSLERAREQIEAGRGSGDRDPLLPEALVSKYLRNEALSPGETESVDRWAGHSAAFALINPVFKEEARHSSLSTESIQRIGGMLEMKSSAPAAVFRTAPSLILVLLAEEPGRIRKTAGDSLLDMALSELRSLEELETVYYSICPPFPWRELRDNYEHHKRELYDRFISAGQSGGGEIEIPFTDLKSELWIALRLRSSERVATLLRRAGEMAERHVCDPAHLDHLVRSLADTALSVALNRNIPGQETLKKWQSPEPLLRYNDCIGIFGALEKELKELVRTDQLQNDADIGDMAVEYIRSNFSEALSLDLLSGLFHVNRVYLGQLIRKKTGQPFNRLVNGLRIEQAKRLMLADPGLKLSSIALQVGYSDVHYFSRIFKKEVRLSPKEFRERGPQAES